MHTVLIGIPTLNGADRLTRCLESIVAPGHTDFNAYKIKVLVCDDGSTATDLEGIKLTVHRSEKLKQLGGLDLIVHGARKGIAASWNTLTRHQHADVVALLNDDVEVEPRWLDVLVYSLTKNPQLGMVSLNQYVGVIKGHVLAAHPDAPPHISIPRLDYHEARLMTADGQLLASQGSLFAFRREAYDLVGGFDERYMAFYEEVDFGVSLCNKGFAHAIASYPVCYHMGGATMSDAKNIDAKAQLEKSRKLFHDKWKMSVPEMRTKFQAQAKAKGLVSDLHEWSTALGHLS